MAGTPNEGWRTASRVASPSLRQTSTSTYCEYLTHFLFPCAVGRGAGNVLCCACATRRGAFASALPPPCRRPALRLSWRASRTTAPPTLPPPPPPPPATATAPACCYSGSVRWAVHAVPSRRAAARQQQWTKCWHRQQSKLGRKRGRWGRGLGTGWLINIAEVQWQLQQRAAQRLLQQRDLHAA